MRWSFMILSAFLLVTACLTTSSGICSQSNDWKEELVKTQTIPQLNSQFPIVEYESWKDHKVGSILEKNSTALPEKIGINYPLILDTGALNSSKELASSHNRKSRATYIVVPGAFTPTCNTKHINFLVAEYNKENSDLIKYKIHTFIIARDNPDVMAYWANSLGSLSPLLHFVPDQDYKFLRQIGVLSINPRLGLIGNRSVFHVENGNLIYKEIEDNNAQVCKTSVENVLNFWQQRIKESKI